MADDVTGSNIANYDQHLWPGQVKRGTQQALTIDVYQIEHERAGQAKKPMLSISNNSKYVYAILYG